MSLTTIQINEAKKLLIEQEKQRQKKITDFVSEYKKLCEKYGMELTWNLPQQLTLVVKELKK